MKGRELVFGWAMVFHSSFCADGPFCMQTLGGGTSVLESAAGAAAAEAADLALLFARVLSFLVFFAILIQS